MRFAPRHRAVLLGAWTAAAGSVVLFVLAAVPDATRAADPGDAPALEAAEARDAAERALDAGEAALRRGDLPAAASHFAEATRRLAGTRREAQEVAALLRLGETQHALGRYSEAELDLQRALELAERVPDARQRAAALGAIGNAQAALSARSARRPRGEAGATRADARRHLEQAAALAREAGAPELTAPILVNLGNLLASSGDFSQALVTYAEAAALARAAGAHELEATALVNASRAALEAGDPPRARRLLDAATIAARALPPTRAQATLLVSLGRSAQRLAQQQPEARPELLQRAWEAFGEAGEAAARLGDRRTASYAWGYLGGLYEAEGRTDEALELTRRALGAAQEADAPDSLYRWQWQVGRLLAARGEVAGGARAYGSAVQTLQAIRGELVMEPGTGGSLFRDVLVPVYYGRADLLLRVAQQAPDASQRRALLEEARATVELLKADELRDYFRDECVLQVRETRIDELAALVVYPLLLEDRTEFIVSLRGRLRAYSVPVGRAEVTREVRTFRRMLEKRTTYEYLPHARRLYDWLVRPYGTELAAAGPETLVIVPDGPLRTIPFGALHDGEAFLIERHAVATAPGLALVEPRPLDRSRLRALLAGLSQPVQGFQALRHVPRELAAVSSLYAGEVLLDEQFRDARVARQLEDRTIDVVHIASHGQIEPDFEETFLLTYDDRLTLDELEASVGLLRFRDRPLELLTLSACDTAAGDDRAALGMAGVAVKAGARSVLATLWTVNDAAAADLVAEFYRQLREPSVSRAGALRGAQQALLADPAWSHPAYWSAFTLIGNWL